MHNRFVAENKPGATMRRGANYSTWWNGGLRTTAYFHNMIGLLTETIGNPTPMAGRVRARPPDRQRRSAVPDRAADVALPPVDRLLGDRQPRRARRRVAQHASSFLFNIYKMGKDSIEKGSTRHLDDVSAAHRRR